MIFGGVVILIALGFLIWIIYLANKEAKKLKEKKK